MRAAFPKLQFEFDQEDPNRSFQRILTHLNDFIATVNQSSLNYPTFLEGGTFTAGQSKTLTHGLGRPVKGILPLLPRDGYGSFKLLNVTDQSAEIQSENAVSSANFMVF